MSAPLWYPAISYSTGNLYRLSSEVPLVHWTEIDLSEISKPKDWRIKKAQHTRLVCCRIQCQTKHTSYAARPTILGVFAWLKFMWHMPSWAYEGSKYWSWIEFMYASLSEMNTRLLSYYQKKFLISFTFKHWKIKQHMPELHKPKYLAGNKILLKDRSNNIF